MDDFNFKTSPITDPLFLKTILKFNLFLDILVADIKEGMKIENQIQIHVPEKRDH